MTQSKIDEAFNDFHGFDRTYDGRETFQLKNSTIWTIIEALNVYRKILEEPEQSMLMIGVNRGFEASFAEHTDDIEVMKAAYKAMLNELLKGVENDPR